MKSTAVPLYCVTCGKQIKYDFLCPGRSEPADCMMSRFTHTGPHCSLECRDFTEKQYSISIMGFEALPRRTVS